MPPPTRPVNIAAGLTQYGTIGAGEFVSNPEYFSEGVRRLPRDWQKEPADRAECSGREPHFWPPPRFGHLVW